MRQRERQAAYLAAGLHPLGAAAGLTIRLHPEAAPADDRTVAGRRCSTCRFRQPSPIHHNWARASNGAGTDVRAWWPACESHEPREEAPDA